MQMWKKERRRPWNCQCGGARRDELVNPDIERSGKELGKGSNQEPPPAGNNDTVPSDPMMSTE